MSTYTDTEIVYTFGNLYPTCCGGLNQGDLFTDTVDGVTDSGDVNFSTPLPAALPLFATGIGAMGLFGWRRKRKAQLAA